MRPRSVLLWPPFPRHSESETRHFKSLDDLGLHLSWITARSLPIGCTRSGTGRSVVPAIAPLAPVATKLDFGTGAPQFAATIREMPEAVPSWFGFRLGVCEGAWFARNEV